MHEELNDIEKLDEAIKLLQDKGDTLMPVFVKDLGGGFLPDRKTFHSAGADLYLPEDLTIFPLSFAKIDLKIAIEIPYRHVGLISLRSSVKHIQLTNGVGIIDADYRGPICLSLHNYSDDYCWTGLRGDRIAQLTVIEYLQTTYVYVDSLSDTDRGEGGFGSTGK